MTFNEEWDEFLLKASKHFNVMANQEFLLFLAGIQALGKGYKSYSKQEKMDLIALGQCKLLSQKGFMIAVGNDYEGWPTFEAKTSLDVMSYLEKERLMREALMEYYEQVINN
ncbi:MAG: hypothetical protein JW717_04580 [Marinilabiliaceae bacterium]|nr:hypothetical protein [Marinilabiliaceae bacterium]